MSITTFACTQCGTVDIDVSVESDSSLCYACRTGEWHGMFEKETFDPSIHNVNNQPSDSDDEDGGSPSFG